MPSYYPPIHVVASLYLLLLQILVCSSKIEEKQGKESWLWLGHLQVPKSAVTQSETLLS